MRCRRIGRNTIHAQVNKTVYAEFRRLLTNTACIASYELPIPANICRPECRAQSPRVDIALNYPVLANSLYVDFTFCTVNERATQDNPSVVMASNRKRHDYDRNYVQTPSWKLVPAAIDTYGRQCVELQELIQKVARQSALANVSHYNFVVRDLRATVAVAHTRALGRQQVEFLMGNTAML